MRKKNKDFFGEVFYWKNFFLKVIKVFTSNFLNNFREELSEKARKIKRKIKLMFFSVVLFLIGITFLLISVAIYLNSLLGCNWGFFILGLILVFLSMFLVVLASD